MKQTRYQLTHLKQTTINSIPRWYYFIQTKFNTRKFGLNSHTPPPHTHTHTRARALAQSVTLIETDNLTPAKIVETEEHIDLYTKSKRVQTTLARGCSVIGGRVENDKGGAYGTGEISGRDDTHDKCTHQSTDWRDTVKNMMTVL